MSHGFYVSSWSIKNIDYTPSTRQPQQENRPENSLLRILVKWIAPEKKCPHIVEQTALILPHVSFLAQSFIGIFHTKVTSQRPNSRFSKFQTLPLNMHYQYEATKKGEILSFVESYNKENNISSCGLRTSISIIIWPVDSRRHKFVTLIFINDHSRQCSPIGISGMLLGKYITMISFWTKYQWLRNNRTFKQLLQIFQTYSILLKLSWSSNTFINELHISRTSQWEYSLVNFSWFAG